MTGDAPRTLAWDPLVEVKVTAAPRSRFPSPEWIRAFGSDGRDPLAAAFEASRDPGVMLDVLSESRPEVYDALVRALASEDERVRAPSSRAIHPTCRAPSASTSTSSWPPRR